MKPVTRLLAVVALVAITGCREGQTGDSGSATGTSGGTSSSGVAGGSSTSSGSAGGMSATATGEASAAPEITTASGLRCQELAAGTGAEAAPGRMVSVHYTGWFTDGVEFDSSRKRGVPIEFPLGTPGIIKGWNEGLTGMKVGGRRKLTIPPSLAYGAGGREGIPPNATLIVDVELVGVK